MKALANVLTGLVALSHIGFLVLEMFFWDHPVGRRIFGMTPEVSASSAALAANQGLYNGFLAAGLLWADRRELKIFFLGCVGVAGVFGGLTAKASILLTQALPAGLALGVVVVASRRGGQCRRTALERTRLRRAAERGRVGRTRRGRADDERRENSQGSRESWRRVLRHMSLAT